MLRQLEALTNNHTPPADACTSWHALYAGTRKLVDDVKAKVKYDLFYIENASWRFDLKILLNTLYVMILRKGHA